MKPNKSPITRFLLHIGLFTIGLLSLVQLSNYYQVFPLPLPEVIYSLLFFSILGICVFLLAGYSQKQEDLKLSMTVLFAGIGFRFLCTLAFLVIYVAVNGNEERNFLLAFVGFYILYTVFEIVYLRTKLRPDFEPKAKTDEAR